MKWDVFVFLGFVVISGLGAAVAFFFLLAARRRFTLGFAYRYIRRDLITNSALAMSGIILGTIASALASLVPELFTPQTLGANEGLIDKIQWPYVAAFAFMLMGMAASYFNRLINERRAKIEELRKSGDLTKPNIDFDVWDFVQPFLVAVITFGVVIARTKDTDIWTNILIGFETGFFWQTILSNRLPIQNQGNVAEQGQVSPPVRTP